jgi:hypothetical protein
MFGKLVGTNLFSSQIAASVWGGGGGVSLSARDVLINMVSIITIEKEEDLL